MTTSGLAAGEGDLTAPPWLELGPSESILWRDSRRTRAILPTVAGAIPFVVAGLALAAVGDAPVLDALGLGLAVVTIGVVARQYLAIRNTEYVATEERLYRRQGVLSRRVTTVDYETVQNVTYSQTITGRLFDHGSLAFDTAGGGGTELTFDDVDDPRPLESLVNERLSRVREGERETVPGTVEQWEAVLSEVRAIGDALGSQ